jgi:hypothetical protein
MVLDSTSFAAGGAAPDALAPVVGGLAVVAGAA